MCLDVLSCAFERCDVAGIDEVAELLEAGDVSFEDVKGTLGVLNLPDEVAFVETVADIVDAIKFAKANGRTVSVKNTGHSFSGSSMSKGSVNINLRSLTKYKVVVECNDDNWLADPDGEHFKACDLANARGKAAFIKFGGGDLWDDVYSAVRQATPTQKYMIMGGAAGSVGAAGGWLQGGGFGTGGLDRMFGLGVDQVLEMEIVLPDERHVKFGPTAWENADGYMYPRTTAVSGQCNSNISPDESEWLWEDCDAPFEDLWYAVRGGGGGTYGVVSAVKYMLHEHESLDLVYVSQPNLNNIVAAIGRDSNTFREAIRFFVFFLVDFFFAPSNLGIDEATSNRCGSPTMNFNGLMDLDESVAVDTYFVCYEGAFNILQDAWRSKVDAEPTFAPIAVDLKALFGAFGGSSYPEVIMQISASVDMYPEDENFNRKRLPDEPPPMFYPYKGLGGWCSAIVPETWLTGKGDDVFELLTTTAGEHVVGGNIPIAHDQMTAISQEQRNAGLTGVDLTRSSLALRTRLLSSFVQDAGSFPGFSELNHICPNSYGPLKTDMAVPCPDEYTVAQKEEECISTQESVWGMDTLDRLEGIKLKLDPDNLFDCYPCVKPKGWVSPAETETLPISELDAVCPPPPPPPPLLSLSPPPSPSTTNPGGALDRNTPFPRPTALFSVASLPPLTPPHTHTPPIVRIRRQRPTLSSCHSPSSCRESCGT
jgi:hypothetical protein